MTVELSDDLVWVEACVDVGADDGDGSGERGTDSAGSGAARTHKHVSVYLLRGGGDGAAEGSEADGTAGHVLVDSGSFHHREAIAEGVAAATGGEGVEALVLSHSDYPHAANVREFAGEDGAELVASSGAPDKQGLPEATKAEIGGSTTVAGRTLSFVDPPLADRSHTTWVYDHDSRTLFTADGFGSRHRPGECTRTSADFDGGVPSDAVYRFHCAELRWLRYVDPVALRAALEAIFEEFPVEWVAPVHGHPIAGDDLEPFLDALVDAAGRVADDYEVGDAMPDG